MSGPSELKRIGERPFLGRRVEHYRLTNGLDVLFYFDPTAPVFSFQTWIEAGSADDPRGGSGVAHLLEHLMFKETETQSEGVFTARLEAAGAPDVNAWTWNDQTVYQQSLPTGNLDLVASLEADRLQHLVLTETALETERDVVLNERATHVDEDPLGLLNEKLWETAFAAHPYRRPVIGWRADLETLTLDHCLEYYANFYVPANATVIIAGNVERDEMMDVIGRHYGSIEAHAVHRPETPPEPAPVAYQTAAFDVDAETETLMLGLRTPGASHADQPALVLLDRILLGGRSSRLYRRLVDAGIATNVQAFLPHFKSPGLYDVTVILRPGQRARDAEKIVEDEFARLATDPVSNEELDAARNKAKAGVYSDWKETRGIGEFLGLFQIAAGGFQAGFDQFAALRDVDPTAVRDVAARYLTRGNTTAIVGRPRKSVGAASAVSAEDGSPGQTFFRRRFFWREPAPAKPTPGGARYFVVPEPSLPLAQFKAVFDAGTTRDPVGREGLAHLTARMLTRGAGERDKDAFLGAVEGLGASMDAIAGVDRLEIGGETLADTWATYADMLESALREPRFDDAEVARLKAETRAHLIDVLNHDAVLATLHHERALFADHAYGRPGLGTPESLDRITRDDVVSFHAQHLREAGTVAGASGAIEAATTERTIEALLGRLPGSATATGQSPYVHESPRAPVIAPATPPHGRRVLLVDKPNREQTHVRIGHLGLGLDEPDFPLMQLANAGFGGASYRSTLFLEIREKRGWSYDVGAGYKIAKTPHSFTMGFSPSIRDVTSAITLSLDLFGRAVREPLDDESFTFFRQFVLNSAAFDEDTADKRLAIAIDQAVLGFERTRILAAIRAATPTSVRDAAVRHWHPSDVLITVLGPAAALEPRLARLPGVTDIQVKPYDRIG